MLFGIRYAPCACCLARILCRNSMHSGPSITRSGAIGERQPCQCIVVRPPSGAALAIDETGIFGFGYRTGDEMRADAKLVKLSIGRE